MSLGFEGIDLIVQSMFPRLKYTGHSFLSPVSFVRCSGLNSQIKGQWKLHAATVPIEAVKILVATT